jgi:formylglycine-generating enzyme required for sulfatase activity
MTSIPNYGKPEKSYHPMTCVSHEKARAFCEIRGKRLPLEDEWAYAAQGRDRRYLVPWGSYPAEAFGPRQNNVYRATVGVANSQQTIATSQLGVGYIVVDAASVYWNVSTGAIMTMGK